MDAHSLARSLDEIEGLERNRADPDPLPPELLEMLPIVPAPEPDDSPVATLAARTFRLGGTQAGPPKVKRSSLADDAWELEGEVAEWGLPGREVIDAPVGTFGEGRSDGPDAFEGFVPRSMGISAQPAVGVIGKRPKIQRTGDGRRYILDNQTFIYGVDDRKPFRPALYPWSCICRLAIWTRVTNESPWVWAGEASGFLAGRSVCVTVAHAFPNGRFAGWRIDVIPGSYRGEVSVLGAGAHTNAHSALRATPAEAGSDLMVLGLYDAIGDRAGYFGTRTYNDRWEDWNVWTIAGYPYDFAPFPTVQQGIAIYDDDSGPNVTLPNGDWWDTLQLESYADSASGLSGAPVFALFDNGMPYAVGVHKGREAVDYGLGTDANSVASGGRALGAMVGWARAKWD